MKKEVSGILTKPFARDQKIGDVISVPQGQFQYLLRSGNIIVNSHSNLNNLEEQKERLKENDRQDLERAEEIAKRMKKTIFIKKQPISENSNIVHGNLTPKEIVEYIGDDKVKKNMIRIPNQTNRYGTYEVSVVIHPKVIVKVNVTVSSGKEEEKNKVK